jgi:hypothetical protein
VSDPRDTEVTWGAGPDREFVYVAEVGGRRWTIRLGDFPAEPMYTLIVDGDEVLSFDDWPPAWRR